MGLIKAMAEQKKSHHVNALIDAIGVEIGNHCQGNIRRIAACALGDINWGSNASSQLMHSIVNKLEWALHSPEDWGLRYSACLALEGIGSVSSIEILIKAKAEEKDPVLSTRLEKALLNTNHRSLTNPLRKKNTISK